MPFFGDFGLEFENNIVISNINTLKFVEIEILNHLILVQSPLFVKLQVRARNLCIQLRGNITLDGNNLFTACYRDGGRKKLLKMINL